MTIAVKIIADSVAAGTGSRLTTMELVYPRPIHSEFMTHRKFGRNASSSRAIPTKRMHEMIHNDPALPEKWTLNEPGMQGYQYADEYTIDRAKAIIKGHRLKSIQVAKELAALGLHKQIINRYTEAHQHIKVVVTSSDWRNFFLLRTHPTAEPTMQALAMAMHDSYFKSLPLTLGRGDWHLPYVEEQDRGDLVEWLDAHDIPETIWSQFPPYSGYRSQMKALLIAVSAARCARTSYNNFKGNRSGVKEDIDLFCKLIVAQPIHASPLEHQATPDWIHNPGLYKDFNWANPNQHGNLVGWRQARKFIPGEDGTTSEI